MIYYFGYAIGKNLGDDACFQSFVEMLRPEYRNLITVTPNKKCMLAVLGGGSLITNQNQTGFSIYRDIINEFKIKNTITFGTGYDFIENDGNRSWKNDIKKTFNEEDCYWRGPITMDEMGGYGRISGDSTLYFLNKFKRIETEKYKYGISYGNSIGKYKSNEIYNIIKNINYKNISLMPVCEEDRDVMCDNFNVERKNIEPMNSFLEYTSYINKNIKIMFSMKLHSTISAYCAGVDYVSFPYRLKCEDFEQSKGMFDIEFLKKEVNKKIDGLV